jgi:ABC-type sugar transport system substrate-binding protein
MRRFLLGGLAFGSLLIASGCGNHNGKFKMGLMARGKDSVYFQACARGAEEAAKELGIDLVYDGPDSDDGGEQVQMLEGWTTQGFRCIAVAPSNSRLIAPALKRAAERGITVLTFDADAEGGRQYFINPATYDDIAKALIESMAEEMGGPGEVGLLVSTLRPSSQSEWIRRMRDYRKQRYLGMDLLEEKECQGDSKLGLDRARELIQANPDLKGLIGLTPTASSAAAEAVELERKRGQIRVVGMSMPSQMRKHVKSGTVQTVVFWKPADLGYLTVYVADLIHRGAMKGEGKIRAGRLGEIQVREGSEVILGPPMKFTAEDIDQFDF